MKLTNLLREKIKIKHFLHIFIFIRNGEKHAIEEKHEELVMKEMTDMLGEKADGATAYFRN